MKSLFGSRQVHLINKSYFAALAAGLAFSSPQAFAECANNRAPVGGELVRVFDPTLDCFDSKAYETTVSRWLHPEAFTCDVSEKLPVPSQDGSCSATPVAAPREEPANDVEETELQPENDFSVPLGYEINKSCVVKRAGLESAAGSSRKRTDLLSKEAEVQVDSAEGKPTTDGDPDFFNYQASDLPRWDFNLSAQGGYAETEMDMATSPGRESEVSFLKLGWGARKDNLGFIGQLRYLSREGISVNDGEDIDELGILLMPSYQMLNQADNGISLTGYGFIDFASNDYGDAGTQTRYTPGAGLALSRMTSIGNVQLAYLFSHDRNTDGDLEITGEKYINIHNASLNYTTLLTENILLSGGVNHQQIADLPGEVEDSSSDADLGIAYRGFGQTTLGLRFTKSFAGYDRQGVDVSIGYLW